MKRRRVPASGEISPRMTELASALPLARASTRSKTYATMSATAIGMATEVQLSPFSRIAAAIVAASLVDMGGEVRRRAVLLDAMGTLVRLEDPVPRLREALLRRFGVDVGAAAAAAAVRAEIAYYRANLLRGRDQESLAALRADCAEAMRPVLPEPVARVAQAPLTAALMEALEFSAYADAGPALGALRAAGCALVVVSNWDVSLGERLDETGLSPLLDAVVSSAEVGVLKPHPAPFERALELAGVEAANAWHAGDSVQEDVAGARAAGIRSVLIDRDGTSVASTPHSGVETTLVVRDLSALPDIVLA
jgi:putative hydrolase of the HAD superfamily